MHDRAHGAAMPGAPRIGILLPSLVEGGVERVALNLAQGLLAAGVEVDLVLLRAEGAFLRDVPGRARIVDLRARRALTGGPALARYLRRERPDALVSNKDYLNVVALVAARAARSRARVLVVTHVALKRHLASTPHRRERLMPRLARVCYPWAHAVVAVSEGAADDLAGLARLPRERVRVIPNPVVTRALEAARQESPRHPWLVPGAPPVVLGVGRLTPQKDFETLLRAFALVRARRDARLLIVGEGPERGRLEALARELGLEKDVELPGTVSNVYAYMSQASVFALSSAWEGLPTVLIEAMACGAPVVATDCPSGPSEILQGGLLAPLVPVGDASALADAIAGLLEAPPDVDALRQRARMFSTEVAAATYLEAAGIAPGVRA